MLFVKSNKELYTNELGIIINDIDFKALIKNLMYYLFDSKI